MQVKSHFHENKFEKEKTVEETMYVSYLSNKRSVIHGVSVGDSSIFTIYENLPLKDHQRIEILDQMDNFFSEDFEDKGKTSFVLSAWATHLDQNIKGIAVDYLDYLMNARTNRELNNNCLSRKQEVDAYFLYYFLSEKEKQKIQDELTNLFSKDFAWEKEAPKMSRCKIIRKENEVIELDGMEKLSDCIINLAFLVKK